MFRILGLNRSKLTSPHTMSFLSQTPFRAFGKDVFVSYSRRDGADFALKLASELADLKFACVIDQWGTEPGGRMPLALRRELKSCRALVIVSTRCAGESEHVAEEIREYVPTRGIIVPVDVDGTIRNASWYSYIDGLPIATVEAGPGASARVPSPELIERIADSLSFRRRDQRLRRISFGMGGILFVLLSASAAVGFQLRNQLARTSDLQRNLSAQQHELDLSVGRTRVAQHRERTARAQEELARSETRTQVRRAEAATAEAREATGRAMRARAEALLAGRQAALARAEVERQLEIAAARQQLGRSAGIITGVGDRDSWARGFQQALGQAQESGRTLLARLPELTGADESYIRSILDGLPSIRRSSITNVAGAMIGEDGRTVIAIRGEDQDHEVWDTVENRRLSVLPPDVLRPGLFSPDLRNFAWSDGDRSIVVDREGNRTTFRSPGEGLAAPVAISNLGRALVYAEWAEEGFPTDEQLYLQRFGPDGAVLENWPLCAAAERPVARFSPNDQHLVVGCAEGLRLWNLADGGPGIAIDAPGDSVDISFSQDGRRFASATLRGVGVWDIGNPPRALGFHQIVGSDEDEDFITGIALDSSGSRIAVIIEGETIFCVNSSDGREVAPQSADWEWSERGRYAPLAYYSTAAYRTPGEGPLTLIDICSGARLARVVASSGLVSRSFSERQRILALVNGREELFLLDLNRPQSVYSTATLHGAMRQGVAAASAPVHAVATDRQLRVWDADRGEFLLQLEGDFRRSRLALSDDGQTFAILDPASLHVWQCLRRLSCPAQTHALLPSPIAADPDRLFVGVKATAGGILVATDTEAHLLALMGNGPVRIEPPAGFLILTVVDTTHSGSSALLADTSFSGLFAAVVREGRLGPLRQLASGPAGTFMRSHSRGYLREADTVLMFAPAHMRAASPSSSGDRLTMDITLVPMGGESGGARTVSVGFRHSPQFSVSADGRYLAVAEDPEFSVPARQGPEIVEIIDIQAGEVAARISLPVQVAIMMFGPRNYLAIAAQNVVEEEAGFRLRLYDPRGWTESFSVLTSSPAECLAFAPDAHALAVGQEDSQTVIYDLQGRLELNPPQRGRVSRCGFVDNGGRLSTIASTPDATTFRVEPASRGALARRLMDVIGGIP